MSKKSRFGPGMNFMDHISESLEKKFCGLKILKFFDAESDLGSGIFFTLDPGWKNSDPQHCLLMIGFGF
jgi:hypothetical protein